MTEQKNKSFEESLTPTKRFIADSTKSPICARMATKIAIKA